MSYSLWNSIKSILFSVLIALMWLYVQRFEYDICINIFFWQLFITYIALDIRSIIKTYSGRLHMEDSFRSQMQLLIGILSLFYEPILLLDGVSRFLHGEFSFFQVKESKHPRSFN